MNQFDCRIYQRADGTMARLSELCTSCKGDTEYHFISDDGHHKFWDIWSWAAVERQALDAGYKLVRVEPFKPLRRPCADGWS